jgi:methionine-rich copper-binding protein CopC
MRAFALPLLAVALIAAAAPAFAHSYPKSAVPPMNGTVKSSPAEVVIDFTGDLEPELSTAEILDGNGVRVDKGDAHTVAGNVRRLHVSLKPLPPGIYTVRWQVTSIDTHRTEGSFTFTVGP